MHDRLNRQAEDDRSSERLQRAYRSGLIVPEKKPFLIDLYRSSGPFLAVEQGNLICDGTSQIATVGLGFNAGALFGASEYLESWINQTGSDSIQAVRLAYQQLLQRKLGSDRFEAHFCASGAEAVETTLAHFFNRRTNHAAHRVLAFEGSFHGRMMVALASTWNPTKREPFAWPGYESVFAPYPEMETDDFERPLPPAGWVRLWSAISPSGFEQSLSQCDLAEDALLRKEVDSLVAVRQHLVAGNVFAILIEPMQCEGGDRYSSARFHQGLAYLATAFNVPLVYDEIQTGFGLGGEFFWHRMFGLRRADEHEFFPDAVVCAKKAQTGLVLIRTPPEHVLEPHRPATETPREDHYSVASLVRGYIQASVVDQFQSHITRIEETNRQQLGQLAEKFSEHIRRPRAKGLSFAFDLETPELVMKLVSNRFQYGLLFYPAGPNTARFRLNLGYGADDLVLFWSQLESVLQATLTGAAGDHRPIPVKLRDTTEYFEFHGEFIGQKLGQLEGQSSPNLSSIRSFLRDHLQRAWPDKQFEVVLLNQTNYAEYRAQILRLQAQVYEPARQSSAEEFDALFESDNPLAILVREQDQIVAMSFAGPLEVFTHVRGVEDDPCLDDPTVVYMLDLTVSEEYRGRLGRVMKQAMTLLAQASGVTAIHGRNRDRLAAGMWAINLSLGSYATNYLVDDYPDDEPYRDCIYYRCPTVWSPPRIDLSSGIEMPLGIAHLDPEFVRENLPVLVNKVTLSNFVNARFLQQLEDVAEVFPVELRHLYTANGLSECVDKVVKVLWRHRRPRTRLLTLETHDFGSGSLLSSSLSGIGEPFFAVDRLPLPKGREDSSFFSGLKERLQRGDILGMFVEPLMRRTMSPMPMSVLEGIVESCRQHNVPIVFNETASLFYRYSMQSFTASGISAIRPDAAIAYLGGQMGVVCVSDELFIDEPLLLISTWEGDALSLAQFHRAVVETRADTAAYFDAISTYHQKLLERIGRQPNTVARLVNGIGMILGNLPAETAAMFRRAGEAGWISCPSYAEMLRFNRLS